MTRPKDCCKDCYAEFGRPDLVKKWRPAPFPGPRCTTHHRAKIKASKEAAHERRVQEVYGLGPGQYGELYRLQTGVCAICKRATGKTRKLSVDHDHATGKVRGLLCRPCNDMLGHARDSYMFFYRAANYLMTPPAKGLTEES